MVVRSHKIYEYVFENEDEHHIWHIRSFSKFSDEQLENEKKKHGRLIDQSEWIEEIGRDRYYTNGHGLWWG